MPVKLPQAQSPLEELLALQIRADKLPAPAREFRFAYPRKWMFDFCWEAHRVAVEVEGGTRTGGRHVRPEGFQDDAEKYNEAVARGWRVLRFTGAMVKRGEAISMIKRVLNQGPACP